MPNSVCSSARAASERSAQRWVRSIASRTSASRAVEAMQTSSAIAMSDPSAACPATEDSGVSVTSAESNGWRKRTPSSVTVRSAAREKT